MPALTSIRALFAWWVVALHCAPLTPFSADQNTPLIYKGVAIVDCFFVLSGIVMWFAHPTLMRQPNWADVRSFIVARLARIYPLHIVTLAAIAGLVWATWFALGIWPAARPKFTGGTFLLEAFLVNGWGLNYVIAWNEPSWSVSSEMAAYLLTPAIFWTLHRAGPKTVLGVVICLVTAIIVPNEVWPQQTLPPVVRVLTGFMLGAALGRGREYVEPLMRKVRTPALLGWGSMAALAPTNHTGLFLAAAIWVMAFLPLRTRPASGFALSPLERMTIYLGETSFAVYLCHWVVLMLWGAWSWRMPLGPFAHPVLAAALLAVLVQCLASALHHTIAEPARRMIRGQVRLAEPPIAAQVAA